jgi:hypothetical protein
MLFLGLLNFLFVKYLRFWSLENGLKNAYFLPSPFLPQNIRKTIGPNLLLVGADWG